MNSEKFRRIVGKGNPFSLSIFPKPNRKDSQNHEINRSKEISQTSFGHNEQEYINSQNGYYSPNDIVVEPLKKQGYRFYDFLKRFLCATFTFRHMRIISGKQPNANSTFLLQVLSNWSLQMIILLFFLITL